MATTTTTSQKSLMSGVDDFKADYDAGNQDAVTREVGSKELVSNQLTDLTSSNSKYIQTARNNANAASAERGMLMSSVAAGASEKAAIESALPIAQQDASTYANTARDNMDAQNTDRQADQSQYRNMASQQQQLEASAIESNRGREFTGSENQLQRDWQGTQAEMDRAQQRQLTAQEQQWRSGESALDRQFNATENATQRAWQAGENASAAEAARQNAYFGMLQQREASLSNTLSAIYSNTALTPAQQQQAAQNAVALNKSIANSYNTVFAQGIPPIFANPYAMNTGGTAAAGGGSAAVNNAGSASWSPAGSTAVSNQGVVTAPVRPATTTAAAGGGGGVTNRNNLVNDSMFAQAIR